MGTADTKAERIAELEQHIATLEEGSREWSFAVAELLETRKPAPVLPMPAPSDEITESLDWRMM